MSYYNYNNREKKYLLHLNLRQNQHGFWMHIFYWCTPMAKPMKSSYCNVAWPCIARSLVRKPSTRCIKNVKYNFSIVENVSAYCSTSRHAVTHFIFTCQTFDLYTSYDEVIQGKPSGAGVIFCKQVLNKCRSESVSHLLECCNINIRI